MIADNMIMLDSKGAGDGSTGGGEDFAQPATPLNDDDIQIENIPF